MPTPIAGTTFDMKPKEITFQEVELTAAQSRAWDQTRAKVMAGAPAFTHILYSMLNPRRPGGKAIFTKDVPIAATDGLYLILNPDTFFNFTLAERGFAVIHEILHCMFNHPVFFHAARVRGKVSFTDGTSLPYEEQCMQHAADYIINDLIFQALQEKDRFEGFALMQNVLHDPKLITCKDSLPDAYRKLYKSNKKPPADAKPGSGPGVFDVVLKPGTSEGKHAIVAAQERNDGQWKTTVSAAMAAAKAMGKLPGVISRAFEEILEPQVSWQDYIRGFFRRKMGGGSYNFRRPDRRLITRDPHIYAPSRAGFGAEHVVVAVDTSGSVTEKELALFFPEIAGILEDVKPAHLTVIWCDAKVRRVDQPDDVSDLIQLRAKGAPGGGGTSFAPVFEHVKEMGVKPDALVYLTDGVGTFPKEEPGYPVLWGNIFPSSTYPWGEVVNVPKVQ